MARFQLRRGASHDERSGLICRHGSCDRKVPIPGWRRGLPRLFRKRGMAGWDPSQSVTFTVIRSTKPRAREPIQQGSGTILNFVHFKWLMLAGGIMRAAVVSSDASDSAVAGENLAAELRTTLQGSPGAIIVFAAPQYDHRLCLQRSGEDVPTALL